MRQLALFALIAFPLCACQSLDVPSDRQLTADVEAEPRNPAVGQEVTIRAFAEGQSLVRIDFDFGDGETATSVTHGAQTAEAEQMHAYESAGSYTVTVTAVETVGPTARAQVTLDVSG